MKNAIVILFLFACGSPKEGPPGPAGAVGMAGGVGATGADGARGATGAQGSSGASLGILSKLMCFISSAGSGNGKAYHYYTALFDNGTRYVTCEVSDGLNSYAVSNLYGASQVGATTGNCSVVYDVDTATAGYWTFQITPQQAQYHDIGSASDSSIVSFGPSGCTN